MIRYSGGPIVDVTYASDGTKSQMIGTITSNLVAAGWASLGSGIYESALTPSGHKIRVDVIDGGTCVHLRQRTDVLINHGFSDGNFLFPVNGRTFRILANKFQFFHFFSGSVFTTDPCDVAFGVPWLPPFVIPASTPPIAETDLVNSTTTTGDDCLGLVYFTYNYGPFSGDASVRIYGTVDDDIRVNGTIWDAGLFPFVSGRGVPCDGIANGIHSFDHTFTLPAGSPLLIEVINNFMGSCGLNAHIIINTIGAPFSPWIGWQVGNGVQDPGGASNSSNNFGFHGLFPQITNAFGSSWAWDTVLFHGDITYLIAQICHDSATPTYENESSGFWVDGSVAVYEPYIAWPSGVATSGGWSSRVRHGQLWDAFILGEPLNSEVTKNFDTHVWRNVTQAVDFPATRQIPHSLLLLSS